MIISRRAALGAAFTTALAAAGPGHAARLLFGRGGPPIGINLYMVEAAYRADADGTLETLAKIGFREVETGLDTVPAERIRAALTRSGLRCANLGILPRPLRGGLSLESDAGLLARSVHTVGAEYLTLTLFPLPDGVQMRPMAGEDVPRMLARVAASLTADHWKKTAELLNAKGAAFKRQGVKFAYHNHNPEFAPLGETNGLAILLENTDPGLVHFQMDAGWVVAAGRDPVEILRAYPGRFRLMHVKDIAPGHQVNTVFKAETTEVGSGVIDWRRVLGAARASGVRHFALEQEPPYSRMPPIEAARKGYEFLSKLEV
ncbi:sugar phosphate isomerase/epimerase [Phenylobacterium sp. LjRoot225]|uniref:sugar phosphate isomerase/epimerase family protein n=1 Tax=Phenylobacterium sp. LjRoot225 TaxID=3342285 RepID=UPI003ECE4431